MESCVVLCLNVLAAPLLLANSLQFSLFLTLKRPDYTHNNTQHTHRPTYTQTGLIEEINIEPEQDMQDPSKINIKVVVEEVQPKSMEVSAAFGGSKR